MKIIVSDKCRIAKTDLIKSKLEDLKRLCTFKNPSYGQLKKMGYPVKGVCQEYLLYLDEPEYFCFPSGMLEKIKTHLGYSIPDIEIEYDLPELKPIYFISSIQLKPEQQEIFDVMKDVDIGLYCAPCGVGKTVTALALIAHRHCRTLILVHTKELLNQWIREITKFLGIEKSEIGVLGDGQFSVEDITVGLMQTVVKRVEDLQDKFDFLLVDEAHHCPCDTEFQIVNNFKCRYKIGTTATPKRKDRKEFLLHASLGDIKTEVVTSKENLEPQVYVVNTGFNFPYYNQDTEKPMYFCKRFKQDTNTFLPQCTTRANSHCQYYSEDQNQAFNCRNKFIYERNFTHLMHVMCENEKRNILIFKYIYYLYKNNKHILVLFDRIRSIEIFKHVLEKYNVPVGVLTGKGNKMSENDDIIKKAKSGKLRVILGTQVADEGLDIPIIDTVILGSPCANNPGRVKQRIGRASRQFKDKTKCQAIYFWDAQNLPYHLKALQKLYPDLKLITRLDEIML